MTSPARSRMTIALALVLGIALVTLGMTWRARVAEGRKAIADADAALGRGDLIDAVLAARIAAEARCPGCTAPDEGFARLERIAREAEARGDDTTAFAAWRAERAALLATATMSTSSERRRHADAEVARFGHRIDAAAVAAGASPTAAATEERLRATLTESDVPGGFTYALIGLGGVVFLVAASRFATHARRRTDLGFAAAGLAVAVCGAALF